MAQSQPKTNASGPLAFAKRTARALGMRHGPRVGHVRWGDLATTKPISRKFGYDRGGPVDRYYIENFLAAHAGDVRGRVLEIKDPNYTRQFGGDRVTKSDVLDINAANTNATLIMDLDDAGALPSEAFDCIILTQTLQYIFDLGKAIANLHRSLAPGGVLLLTVPAITPVRTRDMTWYWSFTDLAIARLLETYFPGPQAETQSFGNLRTATAFLYGLGATELGARDLDHVDPDYQMLVTARAVKG